MKPHHCADHGHVWREGTLGQDLDTDARSKAVLQLPLHRRAKGRTGSVAVVCQFCFATTELETHGAFTRGGPASPRIGRVIPPQFMAVVQRALDASSTSAPAKTEQ